MKTKPPAFNLNNGCNMLSSAGLKTPINVLCSVHRPVMEFPKWKHSGHFKVSLNQMTSEVINGSDHKNGSVGLGGGGTKRGGGDKSYMSHPGLVPRIKIHIVQGISMYSFWLCWFNRIFLLFS